MIEKIQNLKGMTFSTIAQNNKFTIEKVDGNFVLVKLHDTGGHRTIKTSEFENARNKLIQHGLLSQKELSHDSVNSSYIVKIISTFEGVSLKKSPVTLYLRK